MFLAYIQKMLVMEHSFLNLRFENDVNLYGCKTTALPRTTASPFENDVNLYGCKTKDILPSIPKRFENDVNLYGCKT